LSNTLLNFGQRDARFFRQPLPQLRRQIRHPRKIELPLRTQRVINLPAAISGFAQRHAERAQLFFGFAQQLDHVSCATPYSPHHPILLTGNQVRTGRDALRYNSLAIPANPKPGLGGIVWRNPSQRKNSTSKTGSRASPPFPNPSFRCKTSRTTLFATPCAPKASKSIAFSPREITHAT